MKCSIPRYHEYAILVSSRWMLTADMNGGTEMFDIAPGDREPSPPVKSCYDCGKMDFIEKFYGLWMCSFCLKNLKLETPLESAKLYAELMPSQLDK